MSKKLLVDYVPFDVQPSVIKEAVANNKKIKVAGVLQRANTKNQNGRIYPKDILVREAKKYAEDFIKQRRAMGELDHPDSSVVNLQNASHNVTEMHWKGRNLLGTVEVLGTPAGNILKELFKSGIKLGISSRGLGSVEPISEDEQGEGEEDTVEVQPDFELIAFDFVSNPSTHGAFMRPVNESVKQQTPENNIERIVNSIMRG